MNITDYYWAKSLAGGGTNTDTAQLIALIEGTATQIIIPDGTTQIGLYDNDLDISWSPFFRYSSLQGIVIPDSVTKIDFEAFAYSGLETLTTPENLITIGESAFVECLSLTSIELKGVETICSEAFLHCTSLTEITIGESITTIGSQAFSEIGANTGVTIKATTPPTIDGWVFNAEDGSETINFYVPAESVDTYKAAQYWSDYAENIFAIEE